MAYLRVPVGATLPAFAQRLLDADGNPINWPAAVTRTFRTRALGSGTLIADRTAGVVGTADGWINAGPFQGVETTTPGLFAGWFRGDFGAGSILETEEDVIEVYDHVPAPVPAGRTTGGPCVDWITADDLSDECTGDSDDEEVLLAVEAASDILYALSGRQFNGGCARIVRPCGDNGWCGWSTYGDRRQCGCGILPSLRLDGYPVRTITAVKVNGAVLDPSKYRLDEDRFLIRTDGVAWPSCQDVAAADSATGTWSVAYTFGSDVPAAGKIAAVALACELLKGMSGAPCKVPIGWTQLSRQGVTISRNQTQQAAKAGTSGLPLVDVFLSAYNPTGQPRPPAVYSPDFRGNRRA